MTESNRQSHDEGPIRTPHSVNRINEATGHSQSVENLESLLRDKLEEQIRLLRKLGKTKPKDGWEKIAAISTLLSTVVIAVVGTGATLLYNYRESERNRQTKKQEILISETQAVKDLIPQLAGSNKAARRTALLTLCSLNNVDLATRLAPQYAADGGVEALEDLNKRITDPSDKQKVKEALTLAYRERGHSFHNTFYYESAIQDYSKAIDLDSTYALQRYWRSRSYIYTARYKEATIDIDEYYRLSKDESGKYYLSGELEAQRGNYDLAIKLLDDSIKLKSTAEAFYGKAFAEFRKGALKAALDDYSRAIGSGTTNPYWYEDRGECRKRLGDLKGAQEDQQKAERLFREEKERLQGSGQVGGN